MVINCVAGHFTDYKFKISQKIPRFDLLRHLFSTKFSCNWVWNWYHAELNFGVLIGKTRIWQKVPDIQFVSLVHMFVCQYKFCHYVPMLSFPTKRLLFLKFSLRKSRIAYKTENLVCTPVNLWLLTLLIYD